MYMYLTTPFALMGLRVLGLACAEAANSSHNRLDLVVNVFGHLKPPRIFRELKKNLWVFKVCSLYISSGI